MTATVFSPCGLGLFTDTSNTLSFGLKPPGRRRARRVVAVGALTAVLAAACTVSSSVHYQIDWVYWGYHFHVYRTPTAQIWSLHEIAPPLGCGWDPACTLSRIKQYVDLNWFTGTYFGGDRFFDDDVNDFNEALRSTPHPWPLSINRPWEYGCLGGYRNTGNIWNDGDWYGDPPDKPWCKLGQPVQPNQ